MQIDPWETRGEAGFCLCASEQLCWQSLSFLIFRMRETGEALSSSLRGWWAVNGKSVTHNQLPRPSFGDRGPNGLGLWLRSWREGLGVLPPGVSLSLCPQHHGPWSVWRRLSTWVDSTDMHRCTWVSASRLAEVEQGFTWTPGGACYSPTVPSPKTPSPPTQASGRSGVGPGICMS